MQLRFSNRVVVILCVFITIPVAYGIPTISEQNRYVRTSSTSGYVTKPCGSAVAKLNTLENSLANVGLQLFKPPAAVEYSVSISDHPAKSLPALPTTICMVLAGFLCVTFVRDRRFWIACFAALFWVGQSGIENIPRLAHRFSHKIKSCSAKELEVIHLFSDFPVVRSEIESTKYIGLLHYLAGIPKDKNYGSFNLFFATAFLEQHYRLSSLSRCPDSIDEYCTLFSPAFIFNIIPRGPPIISNLKKISRSLQSVIAKHS